MAGNAQYCQSIENYKYIKGEDFDLENNEELAILNNNYESLYNTYTNDFTGIDEKKLLNINGKETYS